MTNQPRRPPARGGDISEGASPPVVAVAIEPGPERVLARVCGEIDMDDADELGQELTAALEASASGLDVDLSGVTFCDSSGLHMLLRLNQRARTVGKSLVLTALTPRITRLLRLTGSEHRFTTRARSAGPA
ncbi:STAS domain-containing protein [Streptomyces sp. NPDC015130]|uniref:STAS domain-containing protein n=1 Tax=Streptomyces sp. NPDC015130 TaxID=3364940 RepID=UPI0036FB9FFE